MSDFKEEAEHELISTSLDIEQIDVNLFRSKSLWVPRRARGVFGGQVISQALVSATSSVDPAYAIHSLHCYFLLSASASIPILYYVERPRQGKSYTTRSVKASQSGKIVFIMICSFHKPEPLQLSHQMPLPPDIPAPDDVVEEEFRLEEMARSPAIDARLRLYYEQMAQDRRGSPIEIRYATERTSKDGTYTIIWWMRARKARGMPEKFEQPFQKCILAYLSDLNFIGTAARTLGLTRTKGPKQQSMGSSLDHSIYYYSNDFDCSEWLLYVMSSPVSGDGRGVSLGRIYSHTGTLIAVISQEGLVRINTSKLEAPTQAKL